MYQKMGLPARQTRFIVSHQPLTQFAYGRVVIIHYQQTLYTLGEPMELRPLKVGVSYKHGSFAVTCGAVFGAPPKVFVFTAVSGQVSGFYNYLLVLFTRVHFTRVWGLFGLSCSSYSHHLCLMYSSCSRYAYHLSLVHNLFIQK